MLEAAEKKAAYVFTRDGGDPGDFTLVDLRVVDFDTEVLSRYAEGSIERDRDFLRNASTWVTGFSDAEIGTSLGISEARGKGVRDRAVAFLALDTSRSAEGGVQDAGSGQQLRTDAGQLCARATLLSQGEELGS